MKSAYSLAQLEAAINYWRTRSPSQGEELSLCPQASALAESYALLIFNKQRDLDSAALTPAAQAALDTWYEHEKR